MANRPTTAADVIASPYPTAARAADRAYAVLKERLLEGSYHAGDRLHVESISEELGVSKQPVMESLRRLSAEGLVVITPQVGCSVIGYEPDEISDFFELMGAIEGVAAAMAAERRTDSDLERLRAISAEIGALRDQPAPAGARGYRILNRQFHGLIHAISGTAIVRSVGGSMMDRSDFFLNTSASESPLATALEQRHADHEAILAAIADGDAERARTLACRHIRGAVELIKRVQARDSES